MEIKEFIKKFASQFDDTESSIFEPETFFRELPEWGSMSILSVIAMVDEEYGIEMDPDDFRKAKTIKDLFEIIKSSKING